MSTIYLVRHGSTPLNNKNASIDRIRGWQDIPLDESGRKEAAQTAETLKGKGIKSIVSSDLSRAAETAKTIGKALGIKPKLTKALRPWNLGDLQGKTTSECLPQIRAYIKTPDKQVRGGGESFNQFKERALGGIEEAMHEPQPVVVVTHHRVERLLKAWDKAGQDNDRIDPHVFDSKGENTGSHQVIKMTHGPVSLKPVKGQGVLYKGALSA